MKRGQSLEGRGWGEKGKEDRMQDVAIMAER